MTDATDNDATTDVTLDDGTTLGLTKLSDEIPDLSHYPGTVWELGDDGVLRRLN